MSLVKPETFAKRIIDLARDCNLTVGELRLAADMAKDAANKSIVAVDTENIEFSSRYANRDTNNYN